MNKTPNPKAKPKAKGKEKLAKLAKTAVPVPKITKAAEKRDAAAKTKAEKITMADGNSFMFKPAVGL